MPEQKEIEIRETYFRMPDGTVVMLRQIGDRLEWHGNVPIVFLEWANAGWPWGGAWKKMPDVDTAGKYFFEPQSFCKSLVKEGPKAMVKIS